jgi:hypothetical protein
MIQSILIARRFADPVIAYVKNCRLVKGKIVCLMTYCVADDRENRELQEEWLIP